MVGGLIDKASRQRLPLGTSSAYHDSLINHRWLPVRSFSSAEAPRHGVFVGGKAPDHNDVGLSPSR
jgi:hypothetical protein